ncbi:MAG: PP2C family protein-serine/threonine phosphatase, partial [bacterium]
MDLKLTRPEILQEARTFLTEMGYDVSGLDADANFIFDPGIAIYLEYEYGLAEAHEILRADSLAAHRWDIDLFDRKLPPSQMPERFDVWISPSGRVLGFRRFLPDSVMLPSLEEEEARSLTESFLKARGLKLSRYRLETSTADQHLNRKDYFFSWARRDSTFGMVPKVWARLQGNQIGGYRINISEPEEAKQIGSTVQTFVQFVVTAASIATFFLLIFVISLFLKKYHEGEVGTRTALVVFAVLFGITVIEYLLKFSTVGFTFSIGDVNRYNVRLVVFFITVFIIQAFLAAMVFAGWSVGESSGRRGWSKVLLNAVDGLLLGKPFTTDFANSAVIGYAFGFIILGLVYGITGAISMQSNFGTFTSPFLNGVPESYFPSMTAFLFALRIAIFNEIVFRLFFISWIREKTQKSWPGLLISSLLWTLIAFIMWDFPMGYISFTWLFPTYFIISVALGLILIRFGLLTTIFTNFVVLAFTYAIPMLVSSAPFFVTQKFIFYGLMGLPLAIAVVGYIKKQSFQFSRELIPTHILRITERERMAKELEIARNVQMSLLPKQDPLIDGYDIAGVCIPALEVGGDYYDFFQLGDGKLGIAIGDVSGKGVPAAIYMTLTKGILQSHAGENISPKEVLNKVNRQMYSNIERNSFVSMFYAVLDMKNHTIRFSRAGHNPAILAQRASAKNSFLQPKGIAVGLEEGTKFNQSLEEHEISLESGDILAFYTDGFTEASTADGDEYGEDRLLDIVSAHRDLSANALIQKFVRSVKTFVGNHPQHDD